MSKTTRIARLPALFCSTLKTIRRGSCFRSLTKQRLTSSWMRHDHGERFRTAVPGKSLTCLRNACFAVQWRFAGKQQRHQPHPPGQMCHTVTHHRSIPSFEPSLPESVKRVNHQRTPSVDCEWSDVQDLNVAFSRTSRDEGHCRVPPPNAFTFLHAVLERASRNSESRPVLLSAGGGEQFSRLIDAVLRAHR